MDTSPLIVFITTPSAEIGQKIADALVSQELAACVNIISPINSIYLWQGKKQSEEESLLIVKTTQDLFQDKLVPVVLEIHPFEVPEIVALPIVFGYEKYLNWIVESTEKRRQ